MKLLLVQFSEPEVKALQKCRRRRRGVVVVVVVAVVVVLVAAAKNLF